MSWGRFDDGLIHHPKVVTAATHLGGRNAHGRVIAVFVEATLYCTRNLTDGFLPDSAGNRFICDDDPRTVLKAMARADVKLLHRVDGGFRLNDFHDYNPSAAKIKAKRASDRRRKQKDSTRNPERVAHVSDRIPRPPFPSPIDQDQDPRSAGLALVEIRKPLRAALHAYLDAKPGPIDLVDLTEEAKTLAARTFGADYSRGRELEAIVDSVVAEREKRRVG
jgi:hypothetical protein